jgi:hypothetical protein
MLPVSVDRKQVPGRRGDVIDMDVSFAAWVNADGVILPESDPRNTLERLAIAQRTND